MGQGRGRLRGQGGGSESTTHGLAVRAARQLGISGGGEVGDAGLHQDRVSRFETLDSHQNGKGGNRGGRELGSRR